MPRYPNGFGLADAAVLEMEEHEHGDLKSKRDDREQTRGASGVIATVGGLTCIFGRTFSVF